MANKKKKKVSPKISWDKRITSFLIHHEKDIRLAMIPIILGVLLLILNLFLTSIQNETKEVQLVAQSANIPVSTYTFFNRPIEPPISAEAAVILDRNTKHVLFEKNRQLRFSMASTTKIMTGLVALEHYQPESVLTAYVSNVEGVNLGLEVGDQLTFRDALYAMLLPSGNDIAFMIAQNYPGGQEAFVARMNEKAKELHLTNTHYADPAGLNDDGNYTTAIELAQLAAIVSQNDVLADIMATKSRVISTVGGTKVFELVNLNRLLGQQGVTGMKTGHTEGAGDVLITSVIAQGHVYIVVVMRSDDRFVDTEILLSYLLTGISTFIPKDLTP